MRKLPVLASFFLTCVAAQPVPDKDASTWWGHIKVLASNDYQGGLTGSPGYRKAAEYVAKTFERDGLKPAGTAGFFQSVEFQVQTIQTDRSTVKLTRAQAGRDRFDRSRGSAHRRAAESRDACPAGVCRLRHPSSRTGYDDFAGLEVRGAVVVYLVGGPESVSGAQRAHALAEILPHFLEQSGAVGYADRSRRRRIAKCPGRVRKPPAVSRAWCSRRSRCAVIQGPMFAACIR